MVESLVSRVKRPPVSVANLASASDPAAFDPDIVDVGWCCQADDLFEDAVTSIDVGPYLQWRSLAIQLHRKGIE